MPYEPSVACATCTEGVESLRLYKLYVRDGMAEGRSESPGRATVTLWNGVLPYYFCNWGIAGWLEGALRLYNAKNIDVDHPVCRHKSASVCQWEIRWD